MRRRFATLVLLALSGALLSGCVAISSVSPDQGGVVGGPVQIRVSFCAADVGTVDHAGCFFATNGTERWDEFGEVGNNEYQVFLGFRLPAGSGAPQIFPSIEGEGLVFRRNGSYEAELTRLLPPGGEMTWIGYVADPYTVAYAGSEPALAATVTPAFALPRAADGSPAANPLPFRPVVGGRRLGVADGPTAQSPVDCGDEIDGTITTCVDFPVAGQTASNFFAAISDVGVIAGKATASPGQSLTLPFSLRVSGNPGAGKQATLSASTNLPGATVKPDVAAVALGQGTNQRVGVPVAIPESAGPGTFDVRLTAQVTGGQTRTSVARLTVRDRQAPVLSALRVKPKRFRPATRRAPRRGATVSYVLSENARVRAVVERCTRRAGKRKRGRCLRFRAMAGAASKAAKAGPNSFRFNGRLRGRRLKPGLYRYVLTPTDAAANSGVAKRARFTVRR